MSKIPILSGARLYGEMKTMLFVETPFVETFHETSLQLLSVISLERRRLVKQHIAKKCINYQLHKTQNIID